MSKSRWRRRGWPLAVALVACAPGMTSPAARAGGDAVNTSAVVIDDLATGHTYDLAPTEVNPRGSHGAPNEELLEEFSDPDVTPASRLQPQPALTPRLEVAPQPRLSPAALSIFSSLEASRDQLSLERRSRAGTAGSTVILGLEAAPRATTDAGNLIGKSPSGLGTATQRRTPIVNDPRVRGNRRLAASGSHWVPARIDLDTALSKLDSRIVDDVIVTSGPYSVIHGPGLNFLDIELRDAPRNEGGFALNGASSIEYKTNGQQWYGRQAVLGGDDLWGFRLGYGHRTGNDYLSGNNTEIPASYKSRDVDLALGADLTADSKIEFTYLRLDQTDVEFPGQAFDIDFLVTDGYEVEYEIVNQPQYDRLEIDAWYNRTRFEGSAQRPGKRRQFPFYDVLSFVANTDVDSTSSGYRAMVTWGDADGPRLAVGSDLRAIRQELNEIASGSFLFSPPFQDANSPIPRSDWINPGLFTELNLPVREDLLIKLGTRADVTSTEVIDDPAKLAALGLATPQSSLADILGTGDFDQSWGTWATYVSAELQLDESWTLIGSAGMGQQPPNLTELYAAQSFMFLLQNGLNTVTGDPLLSAERSYQVDLSLQTRTERFRGAIRGFHAWVHDYITFENLGVFGLNTIGQQVRLKYVNTELATLAGAELHAEYDANDWLTPFGTVTYLDGRDRTRNGDFATRRVTPFTPSERFYGLSRGAFSMTAAGDAEPLPGILPLEGRAGVRVHQPGRSQRWAVEFAVRMVDRQDRVATSLLESPTPGFATFDVRGVWRATNRLTVTAGVENLTDVQYREHLDFRSPTGIQMFQPGVSGYFATELTY